MKTIKRNPASTVVWSVVLFLFIASSGCALLKQPENEIQGGIKGFGIPFLNGVIAGDNHD